MNDLISFIHKFGYIGLFVTVFLESFPMTFFLPGDSLLFISGFLASQGYFNVSILVAVFYLAGAVGYILSYFFGQKLIKRFFKDENSKIFNPKYVVYTHNFYEKYGAKTIIIGRFVPIVRSFGPSLAGVADMTFKKFITYTLLGGLIWAGGVTFLGFYLGKVIPAVDIFLTPIIVGIIFLSFLPTIFEYLKSRGPSKKGQLENNSVDSSGH